MLDLEHGKTIYSDTFINLVEGTTEYYDKKIEKCLENSNIKQLIVGSEHHLLQAARKMLESAYVAQQTRILQNLSLNVEERYHLFIQKYPNIETRISQKYVASYLGITPEFLSRMKNKLIRNRK